MVVLPCVKVDTFASGLLIVIELIELHVRKPIDPSTVYADILFIYYADT